MLKAIFLVFPLQITPPAPKCSPEPLLSFPAPEPSEVIETKSAVSIFENNPEVVLRKGGWKQRFLGKISSKTTHEHWVVLDDDKFDNFVLENRLKEKVAKGELTFLLHEHFTKKMFDEFEFLSVAQADYNIQPPHTFPELFGERGEEILSQFQKLKAELKENTKKDIEDMGNKIKTRLEIWEQMLALDSIKLDVRFSNHLENVKNRTARFHAHTDGGSRFVASIRGTPTMFLKTGMEYISLKCNSSEKEGEEPKRRVYILKKSQVEFHNGDILRHEELAFTVYKSGIDGKVIKALHAMPMESCAEDENRVLVIGSYSGLAHTNPGTLFRDPYCVL